AAGTAAAGDRRRPDRLVVVGELFTAADVPRRLDPDGLVDHFEVAVRRARVIDEPRDVAADVRVAAPRAVDAEHPDASLGEISFLARLARLVVADQLAGVVDDACVLRDRLGGEHAIPVHRRSTARDLRQRLRASHACDLTLIPNLFDV